ncbi:MAG: hypothetical protein JWQ49_975 [Edaphobacter sp.]|nr:hypothetical protein [Edaphobacter sp.]
MIFSPFLSIPLFFVMLLLLEAGRRFRARTGLEPSATIENADFALFGLLLAFTISRAMGRFDEHRSLATRELNAIDTAYRRLDLLPSETQPPIRQFFRDYVTSRLNQYETSDHSVSAESRRLQGRDLEGAVAAASMSQPNPNSATLVLLPALNHMLDITNTCRKAFNMHPPDAVFLLLLFLSCLCAFIAGLVIKPGQNNWLHMVTFAAIVYLTIGAIFDIEYPHHGLIRLTSYDSYFIALRDS